MSVLGVMSSNDRKARLKSLREAAAKKEEEQATEENNDAPVLKFRNYGVKDDKIKHEKVRWHFMSIVSLSFCLGTSEFRCMHSMQIDQSKVVEDVEPHVDIEAVIGKDPEEVIANVAPKKPNWDLRREIAPKLAKLEKRTQIAIAELAIEEEKKRMGV